jgi:hypothetical protein
MKLLQYTKETDHVIIDESFQISAYDIRCVINDHLETFRSKEEYQMERFYII